MSSNGPFVCYRELLSSTSIEVSTFLEYKNSTYLLTATVSTIAVYQISEKNQTAFLCKRYHSNIFGNPKDIKVYRQNVPNSIQDEVRFVISFDEAKFVLAKYDYVGNNIDVIDIINAEENACGEGAFIGCGRRGHSCVGGVGFTPYLTVDVTRNKGKSDISQTNYIDSHLICAVVYGQQLLFIPTCTSGSGSTNSASNISGSNASKSSSLLSSVFYKELIFDNTANSNTMLCSISNQCSIGPIWDVSFIGGYENSALAVLHEPDEMPIGHYAKVRSTKCISVLGVNAYSKTLVTLWKHKALPYDCVRLYPILDYNPMKGSVAIISANAFLIVSHDSILALSTNSLSKISVGKHIKLLTMPAKGKVQNGRLPPHGFELDASKWIQVHDSAVSAKSDAVGASTATSAVIVPMQHTSFVGVLKDGSLVQLHLRNASEGAFLLTTQFSVERLLQTTVLRPNSFSCTVREMRSNGNNSESNDANEASHRQYYWFLSSRLSDALLLQATCYAKTFPTASAGTIAAVTASGDSSSFGSGSEMLATPQPVRRDGNPNSNILLTGTAKKRRLTLSHRKAATTNTPTNMICNIEMNSELERINDDIVAEEMSLYSAEIPSADAAVGTGASISSVQDSFTVGAGGLSSRNGQDQDEGQALSEFWQDIKVADRVTGLGPVMNGLFAAQDSGLDSVNQLIEGVRPEGMNTDITVSTAMGSASGMAIPTAEAKDGLYVSAGIGDDAGLYRVSRGQRVTRLASKDFVGATSVSSVTVTDPALNPVDPGAGMVYLFVSYPSKTRVFVCREDDGKLALTEIPLMGSPFIMADSTVHTAVIWSATVAEGEMTTATNILVQVCCKCVRLVQLTSVFDATGAMRSCERLPLQDMQLLEELEMGGLGGGGGSNGMNMDTDGDGGASASVEEEESIVAADVCFASGHMVLTSSRNVVYMLAYVADDESVVLNNKFDYATGAAGDVDGEEEEIFSLNRVLLETVQSSSTRTKGSTNKNKLTHASLFYGYLPLQESNSFVSNDQSSVEVDLAAVESARLVLDEELSLYGEAVVVEEGDASPAAELPNYLDPECTYTAKMVTATDAEIVVDAVTPVKKVLKGHGKTVEPNVVAVNGKIKTVNGKGRGKGKAAADTEEVVEAESSAPETEMAPTMNIGTESNSTAHSFMRRDALYLVLTDSHGNLVIIDVAMQTVVMVSQAAAQLKAVMDVQTTLPLVADSGRFQSIVNCKVAWLVQKPSEEEDEESCRDLACLCIVVVLESGDMAVYHAGTVTLNSAVSSVAKPISSFVRLHHACVTRKRKGKTLKKGSTVGGHGGHGAINSPKPPPPPLPPGRAPPPPPPPGRAPPGMSSPPSNFGNNSLCLPIATIAGVGGASALCISGMAKPVSVCIDQQGMPHVLPIGFPELPYSSTVNSFTGYYAVTGFQVSASSRGIVSAWFDEEFVGSVGRSKDHPHLDPNAQGMRTSCTLGIYKEVPKLEVVASSGQAVVTVKKLHANCTVHKCMELAGDQIQGSGSRLEKELLKKRTFVLVVSEDLPAYMCGSSNGAEEASVVAARGPRAAGFVQSVLSEVENDADNENYERFFDITDSFAQPVDDVTGAFHSPPQLTERQYKLLLVQGESVVSSYVFDKKYGEHVTDLEIAYLTTPQAVSTYSRIGMLAPSTTTKQKEKHAYIVVGTNISDKHGEDTQGEGRLLFFGLDYARLATEEPAESEKEQPNENNDSVAVSTDGNAIGVVTATSAATSTSTTESADSKSDFFESLQVKVSLLWEGPGPSSFVKQFNSVTTNIINGVPTDTVSEYILATVGSEVFVYKLSESTKELEQVAFYLSQHYIVSVSIVKDYVFLADACGGVVLLAWNERDFNFEVLARDGYRSSSLSTGMLLDSKLLSLVVSDAEGNLQMFRYNPRYVFVYIYFYVFCFMLQCMVFCDFLFRVGYMRLI